MDKVELVAAGGHACLDGRGRANAVTSGFSRRGGGHFGGAGDADTVVVAGDSLCTGCRVG